MIFGAFKFVNSKNWARFILTFYVLLLRAKRFTWCCVSFEENDEDTKMVVPWSWVVNNVLHYPPSKKAHQAKKIGSLPEEDWSQYRVIKVMQTGTHYECSTKYQEGDTSVEGGSRKYILLT